MLNITEELLRRVSILNIEVAEDLKRRLPIYNTVKELNNFFHMLLAQYTKDTFLYRSTLNAELTEEAWLQSFCKNIVPLMASIGLPSYTVVKPVPMYECESSNG